MKILIVSQGPDGGGIHKSLTTLLARLADMENVEADVLLWRKPPSIPEEIVYTRNITSLEGLHGVKSFANCSSAGDFLRYGLFRALRPAGMETLCFHKPSKSYDIAIAYSQMGYSPHYVIDKVEAAKKILFFHHGSYDYSGYRRRLDAAYFKRFDRIATMSRANAEMLSTHFPGISNKISIVGNFINVDNILKLGQEKIAENASDTPVLTTVARLSPEKGIAKALDAALILKKKGYHFRWTFIGDGPSRNDCEAFISANGLDNECRIAGFKANPYAYIAASDIYVQPSEVESYSLTIREAALFRKTIVATSIPAIEEARDEINGLITTAPTPESLADTLAGLLDNIEDVREGRYSASYSSEPNIKSERQVKDLLGI